MATKQLVETSIWQDKWFKNLDEKSKILFLYLLTNNNINPAGIYEVDTLYLEHGLKIKDIPKAIGKLSPVVIFDEKYDLVWLVKYFIKNSKGPKIKKSVQNTLEKYNQSFLVEKFITLYKSFEFKVEMIEYIYSIDTLSIESNDNEHDNDNDNDNENDNENDKAPKKEKTKEKEICLIPNLDAEEEHWIKKVRRKTQQKWVDRYPPDFLKEEIEKAYDWTLGRKKKTAGVGTFLTNWFERDSKKSKNTSSQMSTTEKLMQELREANISEEELREMGATI